MDVERGLRLIGEEERRRMADPELARHYHRAEELIEKYAPQLLPETEGQEQAWVRRCQDLAEQLRDAEYDRFLEWTKERAL